MKMNSGFVIGALIACLINKATALKRKGTSEKKAPELEDGCEIDPNGEVVCENCMDSHEQCSHWASLGECNANPVYMLPNCQKSCNNCPGSVDDSIGTSLLDEKEFLLQSVQEFGIPQTVDEEDGIELTIIRDSISYMRNFVNTKNPTHRLTKQQISLCRNMHALCSRWAMQGECDINPNGMVKNCAPACRSCHDLNIDEAQ